jgi:hypothetical protein
MAALPGEMQGAVDRVALDRHQPALHVRRKPWLHRRGEPAEQRDARRAAFGEPPHQARRSARRRRRTIRRATGSPASAWRITSGAKVA